MDTRLKDALRELNRNCGPYCSPYWWRRASMEKLFALGYAEPWFPNGENRRCAYRITPKGRLALAERRS